MPQLFNNISQFERQLGKGGFGTVFIAREVSRPRPGTPPNNPLPRASSPKRGQRDR